MHGRAHRVAGELDGALLARHVPQCQAAAAHHHRLAVCAHGQKAWCHIKLLMAHVNVECQECLHKQGRLICMLPQT